MVDRSNRRELMIESAARLFEKQGYSATSVRQIADEVGCTEAALYYHFKDGKRELLRNVIECEMPNMALIIDGCRQAKSLRELIYLYGKTMAEKAASRLQKMRWIIGEFPNLSDEEKESIHRKHLFYHREMTGLIRRFVEDDDQASRLTWILQCAGMGYGALFLNMEMLDHVEHSNEDMINTLADLFSNCQK